MTAPTLGINLKTKFNKTEEKNKTMNDKYQNTNAKQVFTSKHMVNHHDIG
jgi:hypothetical protein